MLPFILLDESLLALVDEVEEGGGSIGVALLAREQPRKNIAKGTTDPGVDCFNQKRWFGFLGLVWLVWFDGFGLVGLLW